MKTSEEQCQATISETTTFDFPAEIAFIPVDNTHELAISVKYGNWLKINKEQKEYFQYLQKGKCVGEILHSLIDDDQQTNFINLLSQIYARDFCCHKNQEISLPSIHDSVYLYLTYSCNLSCSHCYMYKAHTIEPSLTKEEIYRLLDELYLEKIKSITFSGGEPLCSTHFCDVVKHAKELGMNVTILSNGTLWNNELFSFASQYIDEVQISIDGVNEDSCAKVRGPNVFQKAVNSAITLANAGVLTSVATTPTEENISDLAANYYTFAKELLAKTSNAIIFRVSSKLLAGRKCGASEEYFSQALHLSDQIYNGNSLHSFAINHEPNCGLNTCGWGSVSFSPDGFAYPCNRVTDCLPIGSVKRMSVHEIFRSAKLMHWLGSVDNTEHCNKCSLRYLCGGGCRLDDFLKISLRENELSARKPCSIEKRNRIVQLMSDTTDYLYHF